MLSNFGKSTSSSALSSYNGNESIEQQQLKATLLVDKLNLINIFKLVLKELIDTATSSHLSNGLANGNRTIDKDSKHFLNFFDIFENILGHGLKNKKISSSSFANFNYINIKKNKEPFSNLYEIISSKCDSTQCLESIKEMTEIKTCIGRVRSWIKLSLMNKTLAQNFSLLIHQKEALSEFYEPESIIISDEANIIAGLLVGLNSFDVTIDLKSFDYANDFDSLALKPVCYNLYLRERLPGFDNGFEDNLNKTEEESTSRVNEIFDQKNYLEELNKNLELKYDEMKLKYQSVEKSNIILNEKLVTTTNENVALKIELESLKTQTAQLKSQYESKANQIENDMKLERETFQTSKSCLDQLYVELQKKTLEESCIKMNLEVELQTQKDMTKELEMAIKILDANLNDKIEFIKKLRSQLEQVKQINLEQINQIQLHENETQQFQAQIADLNNELDQVKSDNIELKTKLEDLQINYDRHEAKSKQMEEANVEYAQKLDELEKEIVIEKNWRQHLQDDLANKNEVILMTNAKVKELERYEKEYVDLEDENKSLKAKNQDLEKTLEEMGSKLGKTNLIMEDFKEVTKQIQDFRWEDNESVVECKLCTKEFNVARRRHHCRRCGQIFCNECSDNKMLLPSSSKPVRVCNNCYETMLQKPLSLK